MSYPPEIRTFPLGTRVAVAEHAVSKLPVNVKVSGPDAIAGRMTSNTPTETAPTARENVLALCVSTAAYSYKMRSRPHNHRYIADLRNIAMLRLRVSM